MTITKKQICFLFISIIPATKLLVLPTVYAHYARQDACIAGLLNALADGLLLAVILAFIKKFDGRSFFDVISTAFGIPVARAVYTVYSLYFALTAILPVFEQKMFIEITLYETAPSVLTFLPFFLASFYFSLKGVNALARTGEIIFWFTALGILLIFFLSVGSARPYYLRPMLKNPINLTLKASYTGLLWHGQPIALLFLAGRIKREGRFFLPVCIAFAVSAATCILLYALFTGIYGDIAVRQIYALTKMTKYAIALSNVGRFDYVATLLVTFGSILALAVPFVFSVDCFKTAFSLKKSLVPALALNLAMLALVAIFHMRFRTVLDLFERIFIPVMLVLVYALPTLSLLIKGREKRAPLYQK